jgi:hypothetical protein
MGNNTPSCMPITSKGIAQKIPRATRLRNTISFDNNQPRKCYAPPIPLFPCELFFLRIIGRQRYWIYTNAQYPISPSVIPTISFLTIQGCGFVLSIFFLRAASAASSITPKHVVSLDFDSFRCGGCGVVAAMDELARGRGDGSTELRTNAVPCA